MKDSKRESCYTIKSSSDARGKVAVLTCLEKAHNCEKFV